MTGNPGRQRKKRREENSTKSEGMEQVVYLSVVRCTGQGKEKQQEGREREKRRRKTNRRSN